MTKPHKSPHSPDIADRRDAMLGELVDAMRTVHHQRRRRKRVAATCALVGVLCGVALLATQSHRSSSTTHIAQTEPRKQSDAGLSHPLDAREPAAVPPARNVIVRIVHTDPSVLQRYAASTPRRIVQVINDEELVDLLNAIDRPTGLVRIADQVWLTSAVTDREREAAQRQPSL